MICLNVSMLLGLYDKAYGHLSCSKLITFIGRYQLAHSWSKSWKLNLKSLIARCLYPSIKFTYLFDRTCDFCYFNIKS